MLYYNPSAILDKLSESASEQAFVSMDISDAHSVTVD